MRRSRRGIRVRPCNGWTPRCGAYQGRGLGVGLLRDAILRSLQAAELGGIRAILVHAMSEEAKRLYERHGFVGSPIDPMTLMITIADAKKAVGR